MVLSQHTEAAIVAGIAVIAVLTSGIGFSAKQRNTVSPFEARLLAITAAPPANSSIVESPGSTGVTPGSIRNFPGGPGAPAVGSVGRAPTDAPGQAPASAYPGLGPDLSVPASSPQNAASIESIQAGGPMLSADIAGSIGNKASPPAQPPIAQSMGPKATMPQHESAHAPQLSNEHQSSGPTGHFSPSLPTSQGPSAAEIESDGSFSLAPATTMQGPSQHDAQDSSLGPISGGFGSKGPASSMHQPTDHVIPPSMGDAALTPAGNAPPALGSASAASSRTPWKPAGAPDTAPAGPEPSSRQPESTSKMTPAAGPVQPASLASEKPQPGAATPQGDAVASAPGMQTPAGLGELHVSSPQEGTEAGRPQRSVQPPGPLAATEEEGKTPQGQPDVPHASHSAVSPSSGSTAGNSMAPADQGPILSRAQQGSTPDPATRPPYTGAASPTGLAAPAPGMAAGSSATVNPSLPSTLSSPPAGSHSSATIEEAPSLSNPTGQPPASGPGMHAFLSLRQSVHA